MSGENHQIYKAKQIRHSRSRDKISFLVRIERFLHFRSPKFYIPASIVLLALVGGLTYLFTRPAPTPEKPVPAESVSVYREPDENDLFLEEVKNLISSNQIDSADTKLSELDYTVLSSCQLSVFFSLKAEILESREANSPAVRDYRTNADVYKDICPEVL